VCLLEAILTLVKAKIAWTQYVNMNLEKVLHLIRQITYVTLQRVVILVLEWD
jgi:hypothetical protein